MKRKKMEKEVVHLLEWIIEYPGVWQIVCNPDGKETSPESFKMAYDMLVKKSLFYLIPVLFATHPGEESLEMQTKNNDEVANGDIGEVIGIFRKDQKMVMRVDFGDGRVMEYQEEDYWPLTLAYAITVHKAQGSEYPMAILPMLPCFRWMLRRNIFYTAVTRARERFIIVGSKRAIAQAIRTDYISRRNTMFGYRIRKIYEAILEQEKSA